MEKEQMSWFKVTPAIKAADVDGNPVNPEILVYDEISADSAEDFNRALKSLGDCKAITMRINSPGGDGFAGIAIHNILAAHPATITCYIDGIAASAASLIAMAADKIIAPENTFMAIHNPYAMTIGPAAAHRAMADDLDRISDSYAATYSKRSKQPIGAVRALMDQDRLMGAKEAKQLGYVDELAPEDDGLVASFDLAKLAPQHKAAASAFSILAGKRRAQAQLRRELGIDRAR
jgi:ATP-dependent Clp protease, protease subunit